MTLGDYLNVLRRRWMLVAAATLIAIGIAVTLSLLATPKYVTTARLFVTTSAAADVGDTYQGNLFSQERVASYAELMTSPELLQRTVDQLKLGVTTDELAKRIKTRAIPETVLIDVTVEDTSPTRAAAIANALSDALATKVATLETPDGLQAPMTRVVVAQPASVPEYRTSPNRKMNVALGGVIGLIAGFGLALLRERFKTSIGDRPDVDNLTESRVLGTLPSGGASAEAGVVDFDGPSTAIAEGYRCLATVFADVGDPVARVTVVTAPDGAKEKSAAVVNLAGALAEAGSTVCVVDGDLRTGALSRQFDREGEAGLTDVLKDRVGVADVLQRVGDLTLLSSGPTVPKPNELLGERLASVIDDLRASFDHVIIDTPPLPEFADALLVSRSADGTVIVVRRDKTKRASLARAVDLLNESSMSLFGIVIVATGRRSIFRRRKSKRANAVRQNASAAHGTPDVVGTSAWTTDFGGRHWLNPRPVRSPSVNHQ